MAYHESVLCSVPIDFVDVEQRLWLTSHLSHPHREFREGSLRTENGPALIAIEPDIVRAVSVSGADQAPGP